MLLNRSLLHVWNSVLTVKALDVGYFKIVNKKLLLKRISFKNTLQIKFQLKYKLLFIFYFNNNF